MLRRIVVWTAGMVLLLSLAAWIVSLFRPVVGLDRPRYTQLRLISGCVGVHRSGVPVQKGGWRWLGYGGLYQARWVHGRIHRGTVFDLAQRVRYNALIGYIYVPVWIPAAAAVGMLVVARLLPRAERRRLAGVCLTCGYNLTGITGPCPECGSETPGARAATSIGAAYSESGAERRSAP